MYSVQHSDNKEFQSTVKIGDLITVYESHSANAPIKWKHAKFLGFSQCVSGCADCKGHIRLLTNEGIISKCLRSSMSMYTNVRLIIEESILEDNLFEI